MVFYNFETKTLVGEETAPIYNPNVSLGHIIVHHLNKFPKNVFQVCADDGSEMTCGEIGRLTKNFAKNMLKRGFNEGDAVGIVGKNSSHVTPVIFGCFLIALPISPINYNSEDDFTIVYELTEPKIIFCDHSVAEEVKKYVETKQRKIEIVVLTEKIDGFEHVSEYFEDIKNVEM